MTYSYMQDARGHIVRTDRESAFSDCKKLPRAEGERLYHNQCCADLRKMIKPNDTIYCIHRHTSASGMQRRISFVIAGGDRRILNIDHLISQVTGYKRHAKHEGLVVGGCGRDMGFAVVYDLGRTLWPKGTINPHGSRNGKPDSDGGYALRHAWL